MKKGREFQVILEITLASIGIFTVTLLTAENHKAVFSQIYIGNNTSLENLDDEMSFPIECKQVDPSDSLNITSSRDRNIQYLTDYNISTRWSDNRLGSTIDLDLGREFDICGIEIAWFNGNSRAYNYSISDPAGQLLQHGVSSGSTVFPEYYSLGNVNERQLRIILDGNSKNNYSAISEIRVYTNSSGSN